MRVVSDLTFSVAVPNGVTATGTVRSEGSRITVETTRPATLVEGFLGRSGLPVGMPRLLGRRLHQAGLAVTLQGPRGVIATIGSGVMNPLGRLLTGSWRVRLGRPSAMAPLARYYLTTMRGHARK